MLASSPASAAAILVVEDDASLRLTLADNLEEEGYRVASAATVQEAKAKLASSTFDVVVLDLMLPDGDGYSLCRELHRQQPRPKILMLTARTLEDDVVRGFDEGADDYVAKPYRMRELLARIRSLARRTSSADASVPQLKLDRFRIDTASRQVKDEDGAVVELTRTEFDLLLFLLGRPGKALARDEILDAVWGREVVVDAHTVDNFVSSLRKKLGWTAKSKWELKAVRGVGYRLDQK